MDMCLFYSKVSKLEYIDYANACYLLYPYKARPQTSYLFTCGDTTISWRSIKQTIPASSLNHVELLTLHEASRECV